MLYTPTLITILIQLKQSLSCIGDSHKSDYLKEILNLEPTEEDVWSLWKILDGAFRRYIQLKYLYLFSTSLTTGQIAALLSPEAEEDFPEPADRLAAVEEICSYKVKIEELLHLKPFQGADPDRAIEPGAAYTHRIWLGKLPSQEKLTRMAAANAEIASRWDEVSREKNKPFVTRPAKVKHYLWTSSSLLLNSARKTPGTEVRDIKDLLFLSPQDDPGYRKISIFCLALIENKEFAHAADILRLFALLRYGGMYLDFEFFFPRVYARYYNGKIDEISENQPFPCEYNFDPVSTTCRVTSAGGSSKIIPFNISEGYLASANDIKDKNLVAAANLENGFLYVGKKNSDFILKALEFVAQVVCSESIYTPGGLMYQHRRGLFMDDSSTNQPFLSLHKVLDQYPLHYAMEHTWGRRNLFESPQKIYIQYYNGLFFEAEAQMRILEAHTREQASYHNSGMHFHQSFGIVKFVNGSWTSRSTPRQYRFVEV